MFLKSNLQKSVCNESWMKALMFSVDFAIYYIELVRCILPFNPQLFQASNSRDLRGLWVDERSNFWWWHWKLVWYLNWRKRLVCRSEDGAGIPRGGPEVNLPLRTLNKFKSFLLSFLRHWSRILYFFNWRHS